MYSHRIPLPFDKSGRAVGQLRFRCAGDPQVYVSPFVARRGSLLLGEGWLEVVTLCVGMYDGGGDEAAAHAACLVVELPLDIRDESVATLEAVSVLTWDDAPRCKATGTSPALPPAQHRLRTWLALGVELLSAAGVRAVSLEDAAARYCGEDDYPLSVFTLLRDGEMLYNRYGFVCDAAESYAQWRAVPRAPCKSLSAATRELLAGG